MWNKKLKLRQTQGGHRSNVIRIRPYVKSLSASFDSCSCHVYTGSVCKGISVHRFDSANMFTNFEFTSESAKRPWSYFFFSHNPIYRYLLRSPTQDTGYIYFIAHKWNIQTIRVCYRESWCLFINMGVCPFWVHRAYVDVARFSTMHARPRTFGIV